VAKKSEVVAPQKNEQKPYRLLEPILFIVVIIIAIFLSSDATSYTRFACLDASLQGQRLLFDMELLMISSLIAVVISMKLKLNSRELFTVLSFLIIFWFVITNLGELSPPCPAQCTFPAGIACVNYQLDANGELNLTIGQGTGHTIKITGVACAEYTNSTYDINTSINNYASDSITINSGKAGEISKAGTSHEVICKDANGSAVNLTHGGVYIGRIYINYTEVDTGIQRIARGIFSKMVYPTTSCWADPLYCIAKTSDIQSILLILLWCALGIYLFFKPK